MAQVARYLTARRGRRNACLALSTISPRAKGSATLTPTSKEIRAALRECGWDVYVYHWRWGKSVQTCLEDLAKVDSAAAALKFTEKWTRK